MYKSDIDCAFVKPLFDIIIIAVKELKIYVRIFLLKFLYHLRQPMYGNAGECADAHSAGVHPPDSRYYLGKLFAVVEHTAHGGEYAFSGIGKPNTRAAAYKYFKAKLFFKRAYHVAYTRLRIAQEICGLCKTAQFDNADEGFIFLQHKFSDPCIFIL